MRMIADQPSTTYDARANIVPARHAEQREYVSIRGLLVLAIMCPFILAGCRPAFQEDRIAPLIESPVTFDGLLSAANDSVAQSRYSDAAEKFSAAITVAEQDPSLAGSLEQLKARQKRLSTLARFQELFEYGQELNFLARDTESMSVLIESLDSVGVWESDQWWDELPAEDLDPIQLDALRWDVYGALLTLDGLLVRRMGAALGGMSDSGMAITFSMVRRYVMTDAGVNESKAAIEVGRRIEQFRPSQATRWYTATSNFRLRQGQRVKASDLGPPENAADGYSLSILCLIAHMDPTFTTWFSGYGSHLAGGTATPPSNLETLRRTIQSASKEAQSHYWSHLVLGHANYWLGEQDLVSGNQRGAIEKFESASSAFTRCIELRPDAPFAYCDRSSVARRHAAVLRTLTEATMVESEDVNQLLQSSLHDARTGRSLAPEADWVHWHEGLTLAEFGEHEAAVECFLRAAQYGIDFDASADSLLMRVIDLRGRTEAIDYAERMAGTIENPKIYLSLLSILHFSRGDLDAARQYAADTLHQNPNDTIANTVVGWDKMRAGQVNDAKISFKTAMLDAPSSSWAMLGLAQAELDAGNHADAVRVNEQVLSSSKSQRQKVAACFAAARGYWRDSDTPRALEYIRKAREMDPACDLNVVVRDAVTDYRACHAKVKNLGEQEREPLQAQTDAMKHLLVELSTFPIASPKRILDSIRSEPATNKPVLQK